MALFYASKNQLKVAEDLIVQVLEKIKNDRSSEAISYNLVMALNYYGKIMMANPARR